MLTKLLQSLKDSPDLAKLDKKQPAVVAAYKEFMKKLHASSEPHLIRMAYRHIRTHNHEQHKKKKPRFLRAFVLWRTSPDYLMVPVSGLEPEQGRPWQILSLLCLPFHQTGKVFGLYPNHVLLVKKH